MSARKRTSYSGIGAHTSGPAQPAMQATAALDPRTRRVLRLVASVCPASRSATVGEGEVRLMSPPGGSSPIHVFRVAAPDVATTPYTVPQFSPPLVAMGVRQAAGPWNSCINCPTSMDPATVALPSVVLQSGTPFQARIAPPASFEYEAFTKRFNRLLSFLPDSTQDGEEMTVRDLAECHRRLAMESPESSGLPASVRAFRALAIHWGVILHPWTTNVLPLEVALLYANPPVAVISLWLSLGAFFLRSVDSGRCPRLCFPAGVYSQTYEDLLSLSAPAPVLFPGGEIRVISSQRRQTAKKEEAAAARLADDQRKAALPRAPQEVKAQFEHKERERRSTRRHHVASVRGALADVPVTPARIRDACLRVLRTNQPQVADLRFLHAHGVDNPQAYLDTANCVQSVVKLATMYDWSPPKGGERIFEAKPVVEIAEEVVKPVVDTAGAAIKLLTKLAGIKPAGVSDEDIQGAVAFYARYPAVVEELSLMRADSLKNYQAGPNPTPVESAKAQVARFMRGEDPQVPISRLVDRFIRVSLDAGTMRRPPTIGARQKLINLLLAGKHPYIAAQVLVSGPGGLGPLASKCNGILESFRAFHSKEDAVAAPQPALDQVVAPDTEGHAQDREEDEDPVTPTLAAPTDVVEDEFDQNPILPVVEDSDPPTPPTPTLHGHCMQRQRVHRWHDYNAANKKRRPTGMTDRAALMVELRQLPQTPQGLMSVTSDAVAATDACLDSALKFLTTRDEPTCLLPHGEVRGLWAKIKLEGVSVPKPGPTTEMNGRIWHIATLPSQRDFQDFSGTIPEPKQTDLIRTTAVEVDILEPKVMSTPCPVGFYQVDGTAPQVGGQVGPPVFQARFQMPTALRLNEVFMNSIYEVLEASNGADVVVKALGVTHEQALAFLTKALPLAKEYKPNAGSPIGMLQRMFQCTKIAAETTPPPPALLAEVLREMRYTTRADLRMLQPDAIPDLFGNPYLCSSFPNRAHTGEYNRDQSRTPTVTLADFWTASDMLTKMMNPAETEFVRASATTVEVKPKLEFSSMEKFYTKSRAIYPLNAWAQVLPSVVIEGASDYAGSRALEWCLLKIDPAEWLGKAMKTWKALPIDSPPKVYVYSDNIYIYHRRTLYSIDGVKMESCIKPSTIQALFGAIAEEYLADDSEVRIQFDRLNQPDLTRYIAPVAGHYRFVFGTLTEKYRSFLRPSELGSVGWESIESPSFVQAASGVEFASYTVEGTTLCVRPVQPTAEEVAAVRKYLEDIYPSCIGRGTAVCGTHTWRQTFQPSGMRTTTDCNTITSGVARLEILHKGVQPSDVGVSWQPSFMRLTQECVSDLTDVFEGKGAEGEVRRLDFLGLDLKFFKGQWVTVLRDTSLYPAPFYHKNYANPLAQDARVNHVSLLMAMLLNGACMDPAYTAAVLQSIGKIDATQYSEQIIAGYAADGMVPPLLKKLNPGSESFWADYVESCIRANLLGSEPTPAMSQWITEVRQASGTLCAPKVEAFETEATARLAAALKGVARKYAEDFHRSPAETVARFLISVTTADAVMGFHLVGRSLFQVLVRALYQADLQTMEAASATVNDAFDLLPDQTATQLHLVAAGM